MVLLVLLGLLILDRGGYFGASKLGLISDSNQASNTTVVAPISSSPTPAADPSQSPSDSASPSATSSESASPSASPSEPESSDAAVVKWSSEDDEESPSESASESEDEEESGNSKASVADSARYCESGDLLALAVTDKHRVSICKSGSSLYYRGESLSSGDTIWPEAARAGNNFTAVNPGSTNTIYMLNESKLEVTQGTKILVDASVNSFKSYE